MKIYEEFYLNDIYEYLEENITLIFVGPEFDERSGYIKNKFSGNKIKMIKVDFSYENKTFDFYSLDDELIKRKNVGFFNIATAIANVSNNNYKNILLDITSLQHPSIFCLIKVILTVLKPAQLFATYVKPQKYLRNLNNEYDFSSSFTSPETLPGFATRTQEDETFISFMGFEGNRLCNFLEDNHYADVYPIIGFPSEEPFWQFETLRNCMEIIKANNAETNFQKCKSGSIFDAYYCLNDIKETIRGKNIVLAPLGTRPHTAACALFAINNPRLCRILYDYAVEKFPRADGIRSVMVYHLSSFIIGD